MSDRTVPSNVAEHYDGMVITDALSRCDVKINFVTECAFYNCTRDQRREHVARKAISRLEQWIAILRESLPEEPVKETNNTRPLLGKNCNTCRWREETHEWMCRHCNNFEMWDPPRGLNDYGEPEND